MNILFTGKYDQTYNRTNIIRKGLLLNDHKIVEYPVERWNKGTRRGLKELAHQCDIVFLPSFTHTDVSKVKRITTRPLVFDPLISRYLTKVFDYKKVWKYSPRAYKNFLKDKCAMNAADMVLSDTIAHKNYFSEQFGINPDKIRVLYLGVDTGEFYPNSSTGNSQVFNVGFYGGFIPLQGVTKILNAAKIIQDPEVHFTLVGDGFEYKKALKYAEEYKLKNVTFTGRISYEELPGMINSFDVCLGVFGDTPKAKLVIPNKVFHYAGCGKPIITMDSPAIREVFTDDEHILLTGNDHIDIVENILLLKSNPGFVKMLSENVHKLVTEKYDCYQTGKKLTDYLIKINKE